MKSIPKRGFTLVELMVVALIVAVLAAVAIPLMTGNRKRAAATEAEAGLGMIRSAMRTMYAQTGAYNTNVNGVAIVPGGTLDIATNTVAGVTAGDLNGRYFSAGAYKLTAVGAATFTAQADGSGANNTAASKGDVANAVITIDQDGNLLRSGL